MDPATILEHIASEAPLLGLGLIVVWRWHKQALAVIADTVNGRMAEHEDWMRAAVNDIGGRVDTVAADVEVIRQDVGLKRRNSGRFDARFPGPRRGTPKSRSDKDDTR